jgi:hypothetical protein
MLHLFMLPAFFAACSANIGAELADFMCEFGVTRHESRGRVADFSAGPLQLDAARHHFDILLV